MKRRLLILLFAIFPAAILAAPSISGVSGTVANGQQITISGSGFGSGPTVLVYDDFEKGTNGNNISTSANSAAVNNWDSVGTDNIPKYSNTTKVSGSLSMRANEDVPPGGSALEYVKKNFPASTVKYFISYWMYIPSGDNWPGEGTTDGTNWKIVWAQGTDSAHHDLVTPILYGSNTRQVSSNNENDFNPTCAFNSTKGRWERIWFAVDGTSGGGSVKAWELTSSGVSQLTNATHSFSWSSPYFLDIRVNAYGRDTANCHPTFDDVYIACGNNYQARIEVGNAATYNASTILTMCTPDSWGASSITAKFWQGSFGTSGTAYLYVIDDTGAASDGYEITLGGEELTITSLSISPTEQTINASGTQQISALNQDSANVSNQVTWSSSRPGTATVSSSGLVTGVSSGSTYITATSGDISARTKITVKRPSLINRLWLW